LPKDGLLSGRKDSTSVKGCKMEELTKERLRDIVAGYAKKALAGIRDLELAAGRATPEKRGDPLGTLEFVLSEIREALILRGFRREEPMVEKVLIMRSSAWRPTTSSRAENRVVRRMSRGTCFGQGIISCAASLTPGEPCLIAARISLELQFSHMG